MPSLDGVFEGALECCTNFVSTVGKTTSCFGAPFGFAGRGTDSDDETEERDGQGRLVRTVGSGGTVADGPNASIFDNPLVK